MVVTIDSTFINIDLFFVRKFKKGIPFDIYIKRSERHYTKIFRKGELVDEERVLHYQEKGVKYFYVDSEGYKTYLKALDVVSERIFRDLDSAKPDELTHMLRELVIATAIDLANTMQIDQEQLSNCGNVVKGCVDVLNKDPKSFIRVLSLLSHHPHAVKHSVMTSIFSILLARNLEIENQKLLQIIGLGAFLHDVGIALLDYDPEMVTDLTPAQWKEMKAHPELGKRKVDHLEIPPEVLTIILQHHEQPNGAGYPNNLKINQIYFPARIVAVADTFCALLTKRPFREAFSPLDALKTMRADVGKFDAQVLVALEKMLGDSIQSKAS